MRPDAEQALVETFRVRVGAVIADIYATIADTATTQDEIGQLHRRLMRSVILLAALMHIEDFSDKQEQDRESFLEMALHARLLAGLVSQRSQPQ
jgi:hypothetical protein